MTYNFDEIIPRRGTCSYKWDLDSRDDLLPLWVADMDFRTAPAVIAAVERRAAHGIYGYTRVPEAYYEAVSAWFARRHGWQIAPETVLCVPGVVPALSAIIQGLCAPGEGVLVQTPVYNCFFSSIRNSGCQVVESPLRRVGDTYEMDFDDLERRAADPQVKLFLLCNPHNPAGRVWTRQELERVAEICLRHGVTVVSDEIHGELTFEGHDYTPFATVSADCAARSVSCTSASKAFNLAGLQLANVVCPDEAMRSRIDRQININEVCDVNPFGVAATIAAYNEGEEWLDALRNYLWDNYQLLRTFCAEHLPELPVCRLEGTYLPWMDCRAWTDDSAALDALLRREARLWLNAGHLYGEAGRGYMRWNIACPRAVLREALERFRDCYLRHRT